MGMKVTLENGDVLELGAECEFGNDGKNWRREVLDMVDDSTNAPFRTSESLVWYKHCRPIRKPEMKEVPMSAVEVAEICKTNWVRLCSHGMKIFQSHVSVGNNGDLCVHGQLAEHCTYSPTPDAPESEWKRFTKMVEV